MEPCGKAELSQAELAACFAGFRAPRGPADAGSLGRAAWAGHPWRPHSPAVSSVEPCCTGELLIPELLTNKSIISDNSVDNELGIFPAGNQSVCWGQGLSSGRRVCLYLLWLPRPGQLLPAQLVIQVCASSVLSSH